MSNKSYDWDKAMNQFTNDTKKSSGGPLVLVRLINFILSFFMLSAAGGLLIMLLNMAVNNAWSSLDAFSPGVGYRDASILFGCFFVMYLFCVMLTLNVIEGRKKQ